MLRPMPRSSFGALHLILAVALHVGCTRLDERPGDAPAAAAGATTPSTSTTPTSSSAASSSATPTASTSDADTARANPIANPSPLASASTAAPSSLTITAPDLALGRAAFSRYCGECHDHRLPTAKAKALAIFDLADARWIEKLSTHQVEAAKGRLKGKATDAEKVATAALLDGRGR